MFCLFEILNIIVITIIIKWMGGKEDKVMTGDNAVAEKRKNTHTKIKIVSFGFIYLVERILAENCLPSLIIIYMSFCILTKKNSIFLLCQELCDY